MCDDAESDAARLLRCLQRGISQRARTPRGCAGGRGAAPHCKRTDVVGPAELSPPGGTAGSMKGSDDQTLSRSVHSKVTASVAKGSAKQISPGVFYGAPLGKLASKPPQFLRLLSEIRRDLAREDFSREAVGEFTQVTAARRAIWATFPRQEQAMQFAEKDVEHKLVVFQYQDHFNGQRRFLATNYDEFLHRYMGMIGTYRHHYEIIQEGKPCHLYFDLEFDRRMNPQADGDAMVDHLLEVAGEAFLDVYGLKQDLSWTVELDSTTADKFSRHLVIHAPYAAFKNNSHAGEFVGEICRRIQQSKDEEGGAESLYVSCGGEPGCSQKSDLFIDRAVYSRNRSFRLPFSSKAGKTAKLLPTRRFRGKNSGDAGALLDSLICRVEENCQRLLTFGQEDGPGVRGGTLEFAAWKGYPRGDIPRAAPFASGKSPFSELDAFVESVACIGNVPGRIRSWYWFSDYGVVVYNIADNRFCENIGRPHKSNGVMYIVDFRTAGYYQKCHDPDCRGYRSSLRPIPRHTIPPEYPLSSVRPPPPKQPEEDLTTSSAEEWDEEAWWEAVFISMSALECASSQPRAQLQVGLNA